MLVYDFSMKRLFLILSVSILLLASCSVTQSFKLSNNGGSSRSDIKVDQFFLDVLDDFSDFTPQGDYSIMDEAMLNFSDRINSSSSSSNVMLQTDGNSTRYIIYLDFSSLEKLVADLNGGKGNTLLSISNNKMSLNLSYSNYEELESVIPFLSDPNFEVYGPRYSNGMSEEEYMDMISFLLGEEGPEALEKSFVSIEIETPGDIVYIQGAMKTGSRKAVYSFPVVDFLTLNDPLSFTIQWKTPE